MTAEKPVVRARNLSKVYRLYKQPQDRLKELVLSPFGKRFSRDFAALHDVSFELPRGRRLGVIGRNGSGKSTLLQILAGTLAPTSGEVAVDGRVAALLELGSGFNPEYTGRENIFLNATILGLSPAQIEERFDNIVAFADIGDFLDQPVKTYSSGMFMRLAFAVTTSVDADVLLVDEALSVGDVFFAQRCFAHLDALIARGTSVVLVTHDTSAVNQFCDSVLVLHEGRVIHDGDTVGGLRAYFALQRATPRVVKVAPGTPTRGKAPDVTAWPTPDAFLDLTRASVQGTGAARCVAVAMCDDDLRPADTFAMGDTVVFHLEFAIDEDLDVPVVGISLVNERNIIVHGRNSLQFESGDGVPVGKGSRLRVRHRVGLDLAPGRYSFVIGLASIAPEQYAHASTMSHAALHEHTTRVLSIADVGTFTVTLRTTGVELPFHGLCQLPGDQIIDVLPAEEPAP